MTSQLRSEKFGQDVIGAAGLVKNNSEIFVQDFPPSSDEQVLSPSVASPAFEWDMETSKPCSDPVSPPSFTTRELNIAFSTLSCGKVLLRRPESSVFGSGMGSGNPCSDRATPPSVTARELKIELLALFCVYIPPLGLQYQVVDRGKYVSFNVTEVDRKGLINL